MSYCKYRRKRKQYLKDGVWYDYSPQVYAKGQLVGCGYAECTDSPDTPPITPPDEAKYKRWITMTDDYYCELGDKYYKMKLQVSNDNINWVDANPPEYKRGNLIEEKSPDCFSQIEEWRPYSLICIDTDLYEQEQLYIYGDPVSEFRVGRLVKKDSNMCVDWKIVDGEYICEEYIEKTNSFEWIRPYKSVNSTNWIVYYVNGSDNYIQSVGNFDKLNTTIIDKKNMPLTSLKFWRYNDPESSPNESTYNADISFLDLNNVDTFFINDMSHMFDGLLDVETIEISNFDTTNTKTMEYMFRNCEKLTEINVSGFNTVHVENMYGMFAGCKSLNHITCKQDFKDWCIKNQNIIILPTAMREGGSGTWEIVG